MHHTRNGSGLYRWRFPRFQQVHSPVPYHMGDAPHLVGSIMVVGPRPVRFGGSQVIAADEADDIVICLLRHDLVSPVDELHQLPVFLQLMAQTLRIVAVDLHMAVKGLHPLRPVEGVIGIVSSYNRVYFPR